MTQPRTTNDTSVSFEKRELPRGWQRMRFSQGDAPVTVLTADHPADELVLPLRSDGAAALHVGMAVLDGRYTCAMQVRVDPGGAWRRVRPMRMIAAQGDQLQDACLGNFDLTRDSVLRIRTDRQCTAAIAYVRVTSPVPSITHRRRNAGVVFDTNMTMSTYRIDEPDDLLVALLPYVDSDFSHIFWGTTVGTYSPLYMTGGLAWHGKETLEHEGDHRITTARVMRMFAEKGIDPFAYAIDFCHEHGLQIWADYRINKNHGTDFTDAYAGGRFLCAHREKVVRHRDGSPHEQTTLSFADADVRRMAVDMLAAQASYDVDGLYIDFCRQYPLVGWEAPVVEAFKIETGHDPDVEPASAWRIAWYEHLCSYVTQFLRELRATLEPIEQQRGQRLPIMAQVPGGWRFTDGVFACMADAMDPATWIREGLVDIIAPAERTALMLETQCLDRFITATRGTDCRLWGAIGPQFREGRGTTAQQADCRWLFADADPWRLMAMAHDYYQQGAEGVFIWEAHEMANPPQRWDIIRRMGDRDHLREVFGDRLGAFDGSHWIGRTPLSR